MGELYDAFAALDAVHHRKRGRQRRDESDRLHARIVWSAWCKAEGGEQALRARYRVRRSGQDDALAMRSDELNSYRDGTRTLSRERRETLVQRHPSLGDVLAWPLFLLSLRPLTESVLEAWMRPFLVEGWLSSHYVFPGDENEPDAVNRQPVDYLDLERLYERGDAYGFFAIACAYRLYDLQRERDKQWYAAHHLIRALPGLCRDERVRPHAKDVILLTKALLVLLPDTSFRINVDDKILWRQIRSEEHEPCRSIRLTAAKLGNSIPEPVSPIVPYRYKRCLPHQQSLMIAGAR